MNHSQGFCNSIHFVLSSSADPYKYEICRCFSFLMFFPWVISSHGTLRMLIWEKTRERNHVNTILHLIGNQTAEMLFIHSFANFITRQKKWIVLAIPLFQPQCFRILKYFVPYDSCNKCQEYVRFRRLPRSIFQRDQSPSHSFMPEHLLDRIFVPVYIQCLRGFHLIRCHQRIVNTLV